MTAQQSMEKKKRLELYEKLYFQGGDIQEKLHVRVQWVFAFALIIASAIHYVIKNMTFTNDFFSYVVVISMFISGLLIAISTIILAKAFWGNKYAIITTPEDLDNYLIELRKTKKQQESYNFTYPESKVDIINPEDMISSFYYEKVREVSTFNMNINNNRQENIHISVIFLLSSLIPLAIGLTIFIAGNFDLSSPRKDKSQEARYIIVTNPIFI